MGFKHWCTPPDFFAALDEEFHFTMDAAASHENALCRFYCTPSGTFRKGFDGVGHSQYHDLDGLSYPWNHQRVFCNPPYDLSLYLWVQKAVALEADVAVLLLPPSVDTQWFHTFIWGHGQHVQTRFYPGRLKFWRDGKPGPAPRAGNLIAVFRR